MSLFPKLKGIQFETAIIERYKRRECSVEEALIEMYLAGVSVRRAEDIEEWRSRPLTEEYPYVYVDGVKVIAKSLVPPKAWRKITKAEKTSLYGWKSVGLKAFVSSLETSALVC